jgi:phospholipase C
MGQIISEYWRPTIRVAACLSLVAGVLGAIGPAAASTPRYGFPHIRHVVMIIQGSRSFDNLFQGFPGADTQPYGNTSRGKRVSLRPLGLETEFGIEHYARNFLIAFDHGKNDRFDRAEVYCGADKCERLILPQYSFVPAIDVKPYVDIAEQYVLADRMFGSTYEGRFELQLQLVTGQDYETIDNPTSEPWSCTNLAHSVVYRVPPRKPVFPCFDGPTIGDELDAAGATWRYYTPDENFTGFPAIYHICFGPDFNNLIFDPEQFLTDISAGELAGVTWIAPPYSASDDSIEAATQGPAWVASLVNAIGQSKYWDSTAVFITWSNYGGFFDHVPPPQNAQQGRAFRVPLMMVSAYSPQGKVTHQQYQHGSLLKFVEETFGLNALTDLDARAYSPAREFDFTRKPRTFVPIEP